jgi:hypothetical protein
MTGVALRAGAHATCLGAGVTRALLAEKSKHSEKRMLETMLDELSQMRPRSSSRIFMS